MKTLITLFFLAFIHLLCTADNVLPIHKIMEMEINSSINPATKNYLAEGFKKAHQEGFDLILIKINTPGGLVSTTQEILTEIGKSKLPVAIWITPEGASATSAGAIISSGAHILIMSDGTSMGAATPVEMSGDIKQKDMKKKAVNTIVGMVEGLAEARGRNIKAFGEMVKNAKTFKARDALKNNLIDGIANNTEELIKILDQKIIDIKGDTFHTKTKNPRFFEFEMDTGQKLLDIFANPTLAYILFLLGAALLYLELQAPGGFLAGSIGVICLIMAAIGFQVLPLNFGAMGLIVLSFILFVMEAYVVSYGILTLAGIASLTAGSLFLFRTDDAYLEISHTIVYSVVIAVTVFVILMAIYFIKDHIKGKGKLKPDYYSLIGKIAHISEAIESDEAGIFMYQVKVNGELWRAKSKKMFKVGDTTEILNENKDEIFLEI